MRTIGIIGGIGPESTVEYYRALLATHRQMNPSGGQLPVLINSIDVQKMLGMIGEKDFDAVIQYLLKEIHALHRAGASVALLAANSPHIVFSELSERTPIPLVSIVEATCAKAKELGLKRLGLWGTRFTMEGEFYPTVFSKEGIVIVPPSLDQLELIHKIYVEELLKNEFKSESRDYLLQVCEQMRFENQIDGVILGGTELPLLLRCTDCHGIPLLNTTQIHVEAVLRVV